MLTFLRFGNLLFPKHEPIHAETRRAQSNDASDYDTRYRAAAQTALGGDCQRRSRHAAVGKEYLYGVRAFAYFFKPRFGKRYFRAAFRNGVIRVQNKRYAFDFQTVEFIKVAVNRKLVFACARFDREIGRAHV